MLKTRDVTEQYMVCDGCGYLMNAKKPMIVVDVPFDVAIAVELEGRDWESVSFHFHTLANRHDCFRYWAHNPAIMENSLKERGFYEEEIADFMELMLYRKNPFSPGIEKVKS